MELVEKMLAESQQGLARLITLVERGSEDVPEIMKLIHSSTGRAYSIGFTGPPGGGKSTLVDRLTASLRKEGLTVGIIAVDPTSPFSGGAVLGDRIRMQQHYLDSGVFIRSMATRGSHGGLPRATSAVMKLMDAFGKDIILVETVGVGQTELDVMETVDSVVVVLVPEAGDTIQTMKAGLMEIADIFVVNKADREGAEYLMTELETMLLQSPRKSWWQIPVLATQAINNVGIAELHREVVKHRKALETTGKLQEQRREHRKREFLRIMEQRIRDQLLLHLEEDKGLKATLEKVVEGELDSYSAAQVVLADKALIKRLLSGTGG